ncbi:MAG: glycosyltransferase [Beijerinckiaceae bacterium]|nr:MAG: glycosyltransferase [Beijerinckiaceae bacterium]
MIAIDALRIFFEIILTVAVCGLVIVGGSFLLLIAVNLIELLVGARWREPLPPAVVPDADLPHVLVQIPAFNEGEMVIDALHTAANLDWPRDKLHIQLLDDSTDDTVTIAKSVIRELSLAGVDVKHVRRDNRVGFKAGALAAGLAQSDAPIIAMLDVDFRPPRDWLRVSVPYLLSDPKAGFLQSRCEFSNYRTNWLTRAQGLLLDSHFVMEQATRYRAGWLFQFNGTGGLWRRDAVSQAGGWSADSLCEDMDLTVRAELAGWHGIFLMEPPVPGLVPERVRHWRVQQRRWSNGFVQVARKLLPRVWSSDWALRDKVSASALILIQAFYPCAAIATVSFVFCLILSGLNPVAYLPLMGFLAILIAVVALGMTSMPYFLLRRGTLIEYLKTVASVPPLMVYVSVSNAPSILKTLFGRREHFKRTPKVRPTNPPERTA